MSFTTNISDILGNADITDITDGTTFYSGFFNTGKSEYTDPVCLIIRVQKVGTTYVRMYANGKKDYNNIWNQRASLTYSHLK